MSSRLRISEERNRERTVLSFSRCGSNVQGKSAAVVNPLKHFSLVYYDSRVVIYERKMFLRLANVVLLRCA